jgi:hypothetical protein
VNVINIDSSFKPEYEHKIARPTAASAAATAMIRNKDDPVKRIEEITGGD